MSIVSFIYEDVCESVNCQRPCLFLVVFVFWFSFFLSDYHYYVSPRF